MSPIGSNQQPVPRPKPAPTEDATRVTITVEPADLCGIFGVTDAGVATGLLGQLLSVIHPDPAAPLDTETVDQALALVRNIAPADATEAMIAVMAVAAEHAAMDSMRRAAHPAQTPGGRQSYTSLGLKAMRTFAALLETLNHGRGKSSTIQRVIVERVFVAPGGQAVVGAVAGRGGGG